MVYNDAGGGRETTITFGMALEVLFIMLNGRLLHRLKTLRSSIYGYCKDIKGDRNKSRKYGNNTEHQKVNRLNRCMAQCALCTGK